MAIKWSPDIATLDNQSYCREIIWAAVASSGFFAARPGLNHPIGTPVFLYQFLATVHDFRGRSALATEYALCFGCAAKRKHAEKCGSAECGGGGKLVGIIELAHVLLLGFAILFNRCPEYGEICLSPA
jgi:hypothetical protein